MDPFVVISLGRKTYRTRCIRHNLNPVYDEKLVFQVMRQEANYSVSFSVVDRDQFSGNDYVGSVNFPLEEVISVAPEADSETGLYPLPDTPEPGSIPEAKKKRFRLPLSRSSSASSLKKLNSNNGKPLLHRENSGSSLSPSLYQEEFAQPPTSAPPTSVPTSQSLESQSTLTLSVSNTENGDDPMLKSYVLPLNLKNKDRWEAKHNPTLYIRAKYLPYKALRQQFWRAMLKQYDADDSGRIDKVELTTMLDTLGSTLHESTIDGFFERFSHNLSEGEMPSLSFEEAVICLEDQLQKTQPTKSWLRPHLSQMTSSMSLDEPSEPPSGTETPIEINQQPTSSAIPAVQVTSLGKEGEEGQVLDENDLADDRDEEHVIEIRECPICHQPRLNKRSDADIITHVATCASQDWRQVNNIVMAGFVSSAQAQRKWYSKVITKISYGGYKLGANSANILVQDRITGQINEERMSVYVRLGIRLLYKGFKANNMEKKRSEFRDYFPID
jgi:phosphatidylserine decarboxylase